MPETDREFGIYQPIVDAVHRWIEVHPELGFRCHFQIEELGDGWEFLRIDISPPSCEFRLNQPRPHNERHAAYLARHSLIENLEMFRKIKILGTYAPRG